MTYRNFVFLSGFMATTALLNVPLSAQEELNTRIGKLTFESGYPSKESVQKLYDELDFQRASQAYIWGIPAVGLNEWRRAHYNVFGGKNGEMLTYFTFAEKLGILTPNYTTPYIATFVDLKESGPFVIEVPKGLIAGMILDNWQRVLADLGVVGPDKGHGGKYLIMPPGYGPVEAPGYFVVQATSRDILAGFRIIDPDRDKAIAEMVPRIKSYTWTVEGAGAPMGLAPLATRSGARCRHGAWLTGTASTKPSSATRLTSATGFSWPS